MILTNKQFDVCSFGGIEASFDDKEAAIKYANELVDMGLGAWVRNNKPKKKTAEKADTTSYLDNE